MLHAEALSETALREIVLGATRLRVE